MFGGQDADKVGAKKGISLKDGVRRRQNQTISLRDQNRKRALNASRAKGTLAETLTTLPANAEDPFAYDIQFDEDIIPETLIPKIMEAVRQTQDPNASLHCLTLLKRMMCRQQAPLEFAAQQSVPQSLVLMLDACPTVEHQQQVLGALAAFCGGNRAIRTLVVMSEGIPRFIRFLTSQDAVCREQAALALGSLAAENVEHRDLIMQNGGFNGILTLLQHNEQQSVVGLQHTLYAITGLMKHRPFPPLEQVHLCLPYLAALLNHHIEDTVEEALWALSYIGDGADRIKPVLSQGVLPRAVELLRSPRTAMKVAAVRLLGNFCQGDDDSTDLVIQSGAFSEVPALLQVQNAKVWKETLWMVSNIAAGTVEQNRWLASSQLVPLCIPFMERIELPVKKEAMWVFTNLLEYADTPMATYLLSTGFLNPYCELLKVDDNRVVTSVLNGISYLVNVGDDTAKAQNVENPYIAPLEANGAIDEIERLSAAVQNRIASIAESILEVVSGTSYGYDEDYGGTLPVNQNIGWSEE